jgi:hypothetical protein
VTIPAEHSASHPATYVVSHPATDPA